MLRNHGNWEEDNVAISLPTEDNYTWTLFGSMAQWTVSSLSANSEFETATNFYNSRKSVFNYTDLYSFSSDTWPSNYTAFRPAYLFGLPP